MYEKKRVETWISDRGRDRVRGGQNHRKVRKLSKRSTEGMGAFAEP